MSNTVSIANLVPKIWEKELFKDVMDNFYFNKNGMMGKDENNIIQVKEDLQKTKGDTITLPLSAKIGAGSGVIGDNELEGNESQITYYSEAIVIDQWRDAVRLTGMLDEQKMTVNMREDAKNKLSIRIQEFLERQFFMKLGGVTNTSLTDVNGDAVGTFAAWSNTPDFIPDADTAAGQGDRYICADYTNGADSLASTDLLTPELISRARRKAQLANPKIQPLKINGKNYYCMFIHPWQAFDLKQNAVWAQAQREAQVRGDENPIFTDALGIWDGVIVKEHEYVPFLDISVAGNSFRGTATGTDFTADAFRALLVGRQAACFAKVKYNPNGWVEKKFDFDNKWGVATGLIGGIQKVMFNSKEYGVIAVDTAATAL